jgi:hypothetical protein
LPSGHLPDNPRLLSAIDAESKALFQRHRPDLRLGFPATRSAPEGLEFPEACAYSHEGQKKPPDTGQPLKRGFGLTGGSIWRAVSGTGRSQS